MEEEFRRLERDDLWPAHYSRLLEKSRVHSSQTADQSVNVSLNRYMNVKAYDRSRIKLQRTTTTDYINANEVSVPRAGRRYILTQGPLSDTLGHFWLMVWEQRSAIIVMLNNIVEMEEFIKCEQYWPERVGAELRFDDVRLSVTLASVKKSKHYKVRELVLKDLASDEQRSVTQFHYTAWPDHGEPESPVSFLRLLAGARKSGGLDKMDEPAVVHCSAGIGRSGTFCLIDSILTMIESQGSADNIDVGATLLEMRDYRMGLIQTHVQLRFAYKCIIYGIKALERSHKLRPHSSNKKQPTNGSLTNGSSSTANAASKSRVRSRKNSKSGFPNPSVRSSVLVNVLEDADSDSLEEAFEISMVESPTLKKPRSDSIDDIITNYLDAHSKTQTGQNERGQEEETDNYSNGDLFNKLSSVNFDKILNAQISAHNNTINSSSTNSTSDPQTSSVLIRRRERDIKLAEKTNEIKMRMKEEELRKERKIFRQALARKSVFYGSIAIALGSFVYMFMTAGGRH